MLDNDFLISYVYAVGVYYIDPNGGFPSDSFEVMCDFEDGTCSTCIDATEMVSHKKLYITLLFFIVLYLY